MNNKDGKDISRKMPVALQIAPKETQLAEGPKADTNPQEDCACLEDTGAGE